MDVLKHYLIKIMEEIQLKTAKDKYNEGLACLKTSFLKLKFTPEYNDAIPYFKQAADIYHGCKKFNEEIEVRMQLNKCFNATKSYWEEGNEYEKIFLVYLNQLNQPDEAYKAILNAKNSYVSNKSYDDAVKALSKAGNTFLESQNTSNAEAAYKTAYDTIEKYFHVLTVDNSIDLGFIYNCLDKFLDLLFSTKKYSIAVDITNGIIKLIKENDQNDNNKISKYYGFQALAQLANKNDEGANKALEAGTEINGARDNPCKFINSLCGIFNQPDIDSKQKQIKSDVEDLSFVYPNSVIKDLNDIIQEKKAASQANNENNNNDDLK